ncbi:MAG: hypothetical protein WC868_11110 [Bacteroidales bacterium]
MKKIFFILFLILFGNILFAQNPKDSINPQKNNFKKNAVFVELAGSSFLGTSINYQRNFHLYKNISLSGSIGAGFQLFFNKERYPLFPVKITIKWNHFKFGIGTTNCISLSGSDDNTYIPKIIGIKYHRSLYYWKVFYINTHPIIGYNFVDYENIFLCVEISSFTMWSGDSDNLFFGPMIGVNFGFLF